MQDSKGRVWAPRLTLLGLERLAAQGIDLLRELQAMSGDSPTPPSIKLIVAVLWESCREEASERGVSREDFLDALDSANVLQTFTEVVSRFFRPTQADP